MSSLHTRCLDDMLTIRLHVDDADEEGGCLHVIPGSHALGILTQEECALQERWNIADVRAPGHSCGVGLPDV